MNSSDRYEHAHRLLKANRVQEARELLLPIRHEPRAADWLQKIDAHLAKKRLPEAPAPASARWPSAIFIIGGVIVAAVTFIAGLIVGGYTLDLNPAPTPEPLQSVWIITATPRPATATLPPTGTPFPTATFTPTETSSPTRAPTVTDSPLPTFTPTATDTPVIRDRWNRTQVPTASSAPASTQIPPPVVIPTVMEASASVGKWHYRSDVSALDDSTTHYLNLEAENSIRAWLSDPIPLLVVRCRNRQYDVFIHADTQLDSTLDDEVYTRVRYGNAPPVQVVMGESTTGEAMFFPDARVAIRNMLPVNRLVVGFIPFNASPVEAIFDLTGLETAIQPLFNACGNPTGTVG